MGKIVIKRNGVDHLDLIQRNKCTVNTASQTKVILSDDTVKLDVSSNSVLDIKINDTIEVYGEVYRINQLPSVKKFNEKSYKYEITAQGVMYDLSRCKFFNADGSGFKTTRDFYLIGTIEVFLIAIQENMHRFSELWEVGTFTNSETKTISFSDDTCLSALQKICQEFKTEFWVKTESGKFKINTGQFGSTLPVVVQYGKGKGLYDIQRNSFDDNEIVNRLYVSGGSQNLPANYRSFSNELKFSNDGYLEDPVLISEMGLKEGSIQFPEIYPKRTGVISHVTDVYKFRDSNMDFDLNEKDGEGATKYLVAGQTAKVHFNKGNLAGYEFEVKSYNHATKEFEIIPFNNEHGQPFPDPEAGVFQFEVGDEYVILDIVMPDTYVTNAETELQTKGIEQFALLKQAKVSYDLSIAEDFIKAIPNPIQIGDILRVVDVGLGIDKSLRVNEVTRNFIQDGELRDYDFSVVIADSYEIALSSQIVLDIQDVRTIITQTKLDQLRISRIGLRVTEDLKNSIFDTDGYFDPENIKPFSIETNMLSVGSRSQQVSTNLVFLTNVNGIANKIGADASVLYSQTLDKQWNLTAFSQTLPDNALRYVYAKVSKTTESGSILVTTDQKMYDADPNDYYILLGMLSSVIEGARVFVPTIGSTTINGGLIRTGIISSLDGQTYFNLNTGAIKGRIEFTNDSPAIQQILDNIVIGSRNYALGTAESKNRANAGFLSYPISDDFGTDDYVVSFDYECTAVHSIGISLGTVNFYDGDYEINAVLQPTETHFVGNANFVRDASDTHILIYVNEATKISNFKIEKGTVATDWTPAPEDVEAEITAIENQMESVNNMLTDISSDNKLTPSEKQQLKMEYDIIVAEKPTVISQAQTYGAVTTNYQNAYNSLINFLSPLLANLNNTSTVNGLFLRNLFTSYYNQKIALLTDVTNAINDDLSTITQEINNLRNDLQDQISDVSDSLNDLNSYVDGSFSDGIISEAEAIAIEKHLNQLNAEKADITARYNAVYNNEFLIGIRKVELRNGYGTPTAGYLGAHTKLITAINNAISDGKTTTAEKTNVDNHFIDYRNALSILSQRFENALKTIEEERIKAVQIGGRNLLRNSDFKNNRAYWNANGTGETLAHFIDNGNGCLQLNNGGSQGAVFHVLAKAVEGKYVASFDVKPQFQSGSNYHVRILAMNVYKDIPIHTTSEWKRYSVALEGTASQYFTIQVLGNQTLLFDNVKFERGTIATDWTPMVEEVDEQVALAAAQAQNALNVANLASSVTDFLTKTTIDGNTVATGMLQVGDANGANAGISGVTDQLNGHSVRFWAGATYQNKNVANWLVKDNGVEEQWLSGVMIRRRGIINGDYFDEFYNPNGQIAKRTAIISGKITEQWYNNNELVYQIGQNGIYYVKDIPESFTMRRLVNLAMNTSTSDLTIFHNRIRMYMYQNIQTPERFELRGNKDGYLYNAGQNVYSESNKQYEGWKNSQDKTANISPNGWYAFEQLGWMMEDGVNPTKRIVELMKVLNGKVIQTGTTLVETNGYSFPQF